MSEIRRSYLKDLASLHRRRGRREHRLFLVEGVRSVRSAIQARAHLLEILIEDKLAEDAAFSDELMKAGVSIHALPRKDLERISDVQHGQGVVAVAMSVVEEEPSGLARANSILVLDGVQDPGNVGTLVRTAAWFGVDVVLAGPGTADFESPKVVRSSMGGLWDVRLARTDDLGGTIQTLSERGMAITAADLDGEPVAGWNGDNTSVLVLGSEAHGISDAVGPLVTNRVTLQSNRSAEKRGVESLNVVVAGGILMERWLRGDSK